MLCVCVCVCVREGGREELGAQYVNHSVLVNHCATSLPVPSGGARAHILSEKTRDESTLTYADNITLLNYSLNISLV